MNREGLNNLTARTLFMLGAILAGAAAAASGGGGSDEPRWQIVVTMTEFAFTPANLTLQAGERYELILKNDGAIPHEWDSPDLIGAIESEKVAFFKDGRMIGETSGTPDEIEVGAGAEARWFFRANRPTAGKAKIICDLEGHREAGMRGAIEIR